MIFEGKTRVENIPAREQLGLGWDQSTNDETAAGQLPLTQGSLSEGQLSGSRLIVRALIPSQTKLLARRNVFDASLSFKNHRLAIGRCLGSLALMNLTTLSRYSFGM